MLYNLTLKDNNQKTYKLFIWFLYFLQIVAAVLVALKTTNVTIITGMYILLVFYILGSIVYFFLRKYKKALETFSLIMVLLYANFWFTNVGVVALIIFIIVYLFVTVVKEKKTTALFSEKGVQLTGILKTIVYPWIKMDNVVLKDNLLTIDFKSNKIIQSEIAEGTETVDEKNFNLFCMQQMQNSA